MWVSIASLMLYSLMVWRADVVGLGELLQTAIAHPALTRTRASCCCCLVIIPYSIIDLFSLSLCLLDAIPSFLLCAVACLAFPHSFPLHIPPSSRLHPPSPILPRSARITLNMNRWAGRGRGRGSNVRMCVMFERVRASSGSWFWGWMKRRGGEC